MSPSEQATRFLRGDREAIQAVRGRVEIVVRRYRQRHAGATDLAQEALGRLFLSLASGRFRGEASLETYAEQVAKHVCLEDLRRRRATAPLESERLESLARWANPEGAFLADEAHQEDLRALASLSAPCLELFQLIFVEELSYAEVARQLGIAEGALRVRLHRCRAKLAAHGRQLSRTGRSRHVGAGL